MKNKDEIEDLVNKELSRLSHDFELDLIRLIKTLSLISQSKSILEKHTEYLGARSAEFQKRLSDFTIALLELEKEAEFGGMLDPRQRGEKGGAGCTQPCACL